MLRRLDAVLLLDKPVGLSSNAALQRAKRLFGARKAGHGGTLDPLASGLLPVLFGEATKFAAYLLDADKTYQALIRLGLRTTTGDAEGEVIERRPVRASDEEVDRVLERFHGPIEQTPPMYSALKRAGQPLYRLARQGLAVERAARTARIHAIRRLAREGDLLEIEVRCGKGTYIRSLAEDLGRALGGCAHVQALRRVATAGFRIEQAVGLADLESMDAETRDKSLFPVDLLLHGLERIELEAAAARQLRQGQTVALPGIAAGVYAVYAQGTLLGVGQGDETGRLRALRLTAQAGG